MPRRSKRNRSVSKPCLDFDMFGSQISFNVDGRTKWNTCCGSLLTILILIVTIVFGFYQFRKYNLGADIAQTIVMERPGYFNEIVKMRQEGDENF